MFSLVMKHVKIANSARNFKALWSGKSYIKRLNKLTPEHFFHCLGYISFVLGTRNQCMYRFEQTITVTHSGV